MPPPHSHRPAERDPAAARRGRERQGGQVTPRQVEHPHPRLSQGSAAVIRLGWPPKELNPNARVHWGKKSRHTKAYRAEAVIATQAALKGAVAVADTEIPLLVTFYPPDNRARDDDNIIASFKAARDGIAQALMRIMRDRGASLELIGKRMQRHHTTVMHALRRAG